MVDELMLETFRLATAIFGEPEMLAVVGSSIVLTTVEPLCAEAAPTAPPAATAVIVSLDVAERLNASAASIENVSIPALTELLMEFVTLAEPTAEPLVAMLTCPAPAPMVEASPANTLTPPVELTRLPSMLAATSLSIVLATIDPPWAEVSAPLPPAATAMICAVELA